MKTSNVECVFHGKFHAEKYYFSFSEIMLKQIKKGVPFQVLVFHCSLVGSEPKPSSFCLSFIVVDFPYFKPRQNR